MAGSEPFLDDENDARKRTYGAGELLWRKGEPSDCVCLIVSGTVALYHVDDAGGETFVAEFGPGELVGEAALYDNEYRLATVRAASEVTVIATDGEEMRARLDNFDTISATIIKNLLDKSRMMAAQLEHRTNLHTVPMRKKAPATASKGGPSAALQEKTYAAGEVLWRKGDVSDCVCLIRSGSIALYHIGEDAEETFIAEFGPNQLVGEAALYDNEPRSATVKAVTDVTMIATGGEALRARIASFDPASAAIIQSILEKMRIMSALLDDETPDETNGEDAPLRSAQDAMARTYQRELRAIHGKSALSGSAGPVATAAEIEEYYSQYDLDDEDAWAGFIKSREKTKGRSAKGLLALLLIALGILGALESGVLKKLIPPPRGRQVVILQLPEFHLLNETKTVTIKTIVRSLPSLKARNVGTLEADSQISVTGKLIKNEKTWYRISQYDGKDAYIPETAFLAPPAE